MITKEQKDNLRRLQSELAARPDVGPVDGPKVGSLHLCRENYPCWLLDITTLELAVKLAKKSDRRCRSRFRIMGIPIGQPAKEPIADHYGLTPEQASRIVATDFMTLPDPEHDGRSVWLERQLGLIDQIIGESDEAGPIATRRDDPVELEVTTEPTPAPALPERQAVAT